MKHRPPHCHFERSREILSALFRHLKNIEKLCFSEENLFYNRNRLKVKKELRR